MLISFSVTNYRSIKDTATLSFLPVKAFKELPGNVFKATDKINLLRSAVIYGANASGKSNVLKALEGFINYITNSAKLQLEEDIPLYEPFRLNSSNLKKSSDFSLEFVDMDNTRWKYSIEIKSKVVEKESLFSYPKGQKTKHYIREIGKPIEFGTTIKGEKKSIEARLLKNQLFLTKGANENISSLQLIYLDLISSFDFQTELGDYLKIPMASNIIARFYYDLNENTRMNLNKLVSSLDTGIIDFQIKNNQQGHNLFSKEDVRKVFTNEFKQNFINEFSYEINTIHNQYDDNKKIINQVSFNIDDESAGTRTILSVAMFILSAVENNLIFIIDEIEQNLHPLIVNALVSLFNNPEINTKNAQLICTTHNTYLLSEDIFRRDQIWFTEKNERGETTLYSMADIDGVRSNIPYDKWYLSGRFGATPIINEPDFLYKKNGPKKK